PDVLLDNTDRNRTSPFAFTGNKWEFRAVGSTANCAGPMTVLNTIVAKQLRDFKNEVDALVENDGLKRDEAIFNVLREYIKDSERILFEGDGYGDEWEKEAAKRGLSNNKTTPSALKAKIDPKAIATFEEMAVMSSVEIHARYEIELEEYVKRIQIEGRVLGDIARNHVIPTAIRYQNLVIENVKGLKEIFGNEEFATIAAEQLQMIKKISHHIEQINVKVTEMTNERKIANNIEDVEKQAHAYCDKVKPYFDVIRYHSDKLEIMVDNELWTLTKYRELLFTN
ncbi:MAG: glutamine synthetase type III, partial [Flavobacterium sp.]